MSRKIHPPTFTFVGHRTRTITNPKTLVTQTIEWDTFEAATYYTWNDILYPNAIHFHRRTSDQVLFINEPSTPSGGDDIWMNVIFFPDFKSVLDYKVRFDTPHPRDEVAVRAYEERPRFTEDVIRALLAMPFPSQ